MSSQSSLSDLRAFQFTKENEEVNTRITENRNDNIHSPSPFSSQMSTFNASLHSSSSIHKVLPPIKPLQKNQNVELSLQRLMTCMKDQLADCKTSVQTAKHHLWDRIGHIIIHDEDDTSCLRELDCAMESLKMSVSKMSSLQTLVICFEEIVGSAKERTALSELKRAGLYGRAIIFLMRFDAVLGRVLDASG